MLWHLAVYCTISSLFFVGMEAGGKVQKPIQNKNTNVVQKQTSKGSSLGLQEGDDDNLTFSKYHDVCENLTSGYAELRLVHDLLHCIDGIQASARVERYCIRPVRNAYDAVNVPLSFSIMQISALDEKTQVLTTTGWLTPYWYDELMRWDPSSYDNIQFIQLPAHQIWTPVFGLDNHADKVYDPSFRADFQATLSHTGRVIWEVGNQFISSCTIELTFYPFDMQKCHLSFQSYSHTADKLCIFNEENKINDEDFQSNGEWQILATKACTSIRTFDVSTHQNADTRRKKYFATVDYYILMKRKPMFYIINILIPCGMISALILMVFWLPPDAGEKISLGTTVLLAFSVFQLVIAENMPKTSDSVPVLAVYLAAFMGMTTLSVILSVFVLRLHHHDAASSSPSLNKFGRFMIRHFSFLIDIDDVTADQIIVVSQKEDNTPFIKKMLYKGKGINAARKFRKPQMYQPKKIPENGLLMVHTEAAEIYTSTNDNGRSHGETEELCSAFTSEGVGMQLQAIFEELKSIKDSMKEKHIKEVSTEAIRKEWRLFARIIDRILLITHGGAIFAIVIFILVYMSTMNTEPLVRELCQNPVHTSPVVDKPTNETACFGNIAETSKWFIKIGDNWTTLNGLQPPHGCLCGLFTDDNSTLL